MPKIAAELDEEANGFSAKEVSWASEKQAVWRCPRSHRYTLRIDLRTRLGRECTICTNRELLTGFNDLATKAPWLVAEWMAAENGKPASQVLCAYDGHAYAWKCLNCTYIFRQKINARLNGAGCPACAGKVLVPGFNDLATKRPDLLAIWDYERNDITPQEIIWSSSRKVWWICPQGHRAFRSPNATTQAGACAPCAGVALNPGVTDLETTSPALAKQWSTKNDRAPHEVSQYSSYRAIWDCPDDPTHEWKSTVANRSAAGTGCPHCVSGGATSDVEIRLRIALAAALSDVANVDPHGVTLQGIPTGRRSYSRVDIYAELHDGRNLIVEYDGAYWHADKAVKDIAKTERLLKAGYLVVRVREANLPALELTDPNLLQICEVEPYYGDKRSTELARVLTEVADFLGLTTSHGDFGLAV